MSSAIVISGQNGEKPAENQCLRKINGGMDHHMLDLTLIGLTKHINSMGVLKESFVFAE
jgi:hypothetical protein